MEQADKVAVLTGPARGTGNAIVVALAGAGLLSFARIGQLMRLSHWLAATRNK